MFKAQKLSPKLQWVDRPRSKDVRSMLRDVGRRTRWKLTPKFLEQEELFKDGIEVDEACSRILIIFRVALR